MALLSLSMVAQTKMYSFCNVETRNSAREWEEARFIGYQTLTISKNSINLRLDRNYNLNIAQITYLPENGAIYLCTDDLKNNITLMVMSDYKVILYDEGKRFRFNLEPMMIEPAYDGFVEAE